MAKFWQAICEILPIDPNMIPLALTIITAAIGGMGILVIGITSAKIKSFTTGDKGKRSIPKEAMDNLIKAYNKIFSTFNMKAAESMLTENLHYTTKCTVDALQKLGVKKDIDVKVDEEAAKVMENQAINIIMEDGKNDMTITTLPCEYTETYYDTTTDKKIYSDTCKAQLTLSFLKSNQVEKDKVTYCINCGTPIEPQGDFYDCPNCKSHYSAENYQWTINDVQIQKRSDLKTALILGGFVILLLLGVAEIIINKFVFGLALVGINLLALVAVIASLVWLNKALSVFKVMAADDPLSSRMTFIKRITYLVRALEMARDFELSKTKPFTTPELYKKIEAVNKYDEYYLLDFNFKNAVLSNYRTEGEYRHVNVKMKIEQLILRKKDNKKKIKKKTKKLNYAVMKHVSAMTQVNEGYKTITCKCCGANINLTIDGKCKCCGDNYDVSRYDWILTDAPVELTK